MQSLEFPNAVNSAVDIGPGMCPMVIIIVIIIIIIIFIIIITLLLLL